MRGNPFSYYFIIIVYFYMDYLDCLDEPHVYKVLRRPCGVHAVQSPRTSLPSEPKTGHCGLSATTELPQTGH